MKSDSSSNVEHDPPPKIKSQPPSEMKPQPSTELDVPPPYSVSPPALTRENETAPRRRPRQRCSMPIRARSTQLQRYLIEIVTFSLNANFGLVCQAIGGYGPGSSYSQEEMDSILTEEEHEELLRLATITLNLYHKYMNNQWNLTLDSDRATIRTAILEPAHSVYQRALRTGHGLHTC
jgi:hypothetical protein